MFGSEDMIYLSSLCLSTSHAACVDKLAGRDPRDPMSTRTHLPVAFSECAHLPIVETFFASPWCKGGGSLRLFPISPFPAGVCVIGPYGLCNWSFFDHRIAIIAPVDGGRDTKWEMWGLVWRHYCLTSRYYARQGIGSSSGLCHAASRQAP